MARQFSRNLYRRHVSTRTQGAFLISILLALVALTHTSLAQVTMDSLWVRFGGVAAMSFSPDSKSLLVADPDGTIRTFDARTGLQKDSMKVYPFRVLDVQYSPDGSMIIAVAGYSVSFFNTETGKLIDTVAVKTLGEINYSDDKSKFVISGDGLIQVIDIPGRRVLSTLTRPESYKVAPPKNIEYYNNGRVAFSADGRYIIGKYASSIVQWDWRDTTKQPEVLMGSMPNLAIIGFSPDRSLFVMQSNHLWSLTEKKEITNRIGGLTPYASSYAESIAFTESGRFLFTTDQNTPRIINISSNTIVCYSQQVAIGNIVVSKDSSYAAMLIGRDGPIVLRVNWGTTDVQENPDIKPLAQVIPMPGIENLAYSLSSPYSLPNVMLSVVTMDGRSVQDVYRGTIEAGTTRIPIPTGGMASGAYTARLQYGSTVISTPFIITK